VTVENPSSTPATFDVYPTDAATAAATGVTYSSMGASLHDTGTWIHLDASSVSLGPGQSRAIGFSVTVPSGASPGDHIGGISAQNPSSAPPGATGVTEPGPGPQESVSTRVVVAVVIHVPGAAAVSYRLGNPAVATSSNGGTLVEIPIDDTGSLLSKPYLNSNVRSCGSSHTLATLARQLDTFVPRTSISYEWVLGRRLAAGCYTVSASLYSGTALLAGVNATAVAPARNATGGTGPRGVGAGSAPRPSGDPPEWIVALDSALLLSVGAAGATAVLVERRRGIRR
jgi:hypothetical protein